MSKAFDFVDPKYLVKYFVTMSLVWSETASFIAEKTSVGNIEDQLFDAGQFLFFTLSLIAFFLGVSIFAIDFSATQVGIIFSGALIFIFFEAMALRLSWICVGAKAPFKLYLIADFYYWGASCAASFVLLAMAYGLANYSFWFWIPIALAAAAPALLLIRIWSAYAILGFVASRKRSFFAALLYIFVFGLLPFFIVLPLIPFVGRVFP